MSIVVPTHNEASVIGARIQNVGASEYPQHLIEVVVVDSGSTDGTATRAEEAARHARVAVKVVRERSRRGKAAAINTALAHCGGELVVLTDAPTVFAPDCLWRMVATFDDPRVGAATGHFNVTGEGTRLQAEEQRFWRMRNALRRLEAEVDSTPFLSGELAVFRRQLVKALDEDSLADDMNLALQVRRSGWRVAVVPDATFEERRSAVAHELLATKSRRAAGGIQELLRSRDMLFRRRYGAFGLLILPSAWLYYLPLRVPAMLAALLLLPRRRRALWLTLATGGLGWAGSRNGWARLALLNEAVLLLGWRRILTGDVDVRWRQERTTRDGHGVAVSKPA